MEFVADLHIHSKYSRATSPRMNITDLSNAAHVKGVNLLGTGDFTHPRHFADLKRDLTPLGNGMYSHNNCFFMLTSEISLMYSQNGKGRRVHLVTLAPDLEIVEQINSGLKKWGNLDYDGRPIFGKTAVEYVDLCQSISKDIEIIPAHIWTPWFGMLGSMSGFNSVEECFGEKSKHIHALETGMSCYDSETEVLTNNGWKRVSEAEISDEVCTLNLEKNVIEFQKPVRLFKYLYNGKMYELKTKRVDLLVTPNHKLLYSGCDFRKKPEFKLKEAELLFGKSKLFKKDGIWVGDSPVHFVLPAVKMKHGSRYYSGFRQKKEKKLPIKQWLKFFGFWVAEGWTTEGKDGDYNVYLCNTNEKLLSEMKSILESFGFNVYKDGIVIRVRDYQLFHYLKKFGKSSKKLVPNEVKSLSKELLEVFFDYYIKGDGHRYGRTGKGLSATTISKRLRDDLQEMALKMGMSAYYKLHNKKGTPFSSPGQKHKKIYRQSEDSWVIYFIRKNTHAVLPSVIKKYNYVESWVDYNDFVHCLEVPNHVIYVRRNGIPVWCGNSDPAMNWRLSSLDKYALVSFSDSHSPYPWRLGRECCVFDLKKPSYFELTEAIRNKDKKKFVSTIETSPEYGKYHYDGHRDCNVSFSPAESKKLNNICPVCRKPLTIGVENRVEELADRSVGFMPKSAIPFKRIIPLHEVICGLLKTGVASKKTEEQASRLIASFGSELNVLLKAPENALREISGDKIAGALMKNREGLIKIKPGYDGEYGVPVFDENDVIDEKPAKPSQKTLGEF